LRTGEETEEDPTFSSREREREKEHEVEKILNR